MLPPARFVGLGALKLQHIACLCKRPPDHRAAVPDVRPAERQNLAARRQPVAATTEGWILIGVEGDARALLKRALESSTRRDLRQPGSS
jgi:hypothetical protein